MSVDVLFKRYFNVVLLVVVALAAYLQARGVSYLFSSALAPEVAIALPPLPPSKSVPMARLSAHMIHERNPFDSVTGSLFPKAEEQAAARGPVEITDPLAVPVCPGVKVHILTESNDPLWSFAAIQAGGDSTPILRRVGDAVGDKKVAYIGFNPATASPTVWLEGDSVCQSSLFGIEPPPPSVAPEAVAPAETASKGGRALDPEIASKIRKISDTEYEIDRSAVDKIMTDQAELMKSARIVPEQKDGKVLGIRLFGIRPETLLGTMGFQNGDRLETINGFDMGSPEKALEAYARLRTASNLNIKVNRRGKDMSVDYHIK